MKYHHPLNEIRSRTRMYWDRDETGPAVREAFRRADQCRTAALGAEVYSSENQELILTKHKFQGHHVYDAGFALALFSR